MEKKVAGSYFKDDAERVEDVITITLEQEEVTVSANDGGVMICMTVEDFKRIAKEIIESE